MKNNKVLLLIAEELKKLKEQSSIGAITNNSSIPNPIINNQCHLPHTAAPIIGECLKSQCALISNCEGGEGIDIRCVPCNNR